MQQLSCSMHFWYILLILNRCFGPWHEQSGELQSAIKYYERRLPLATTFGIAPSGAEVQITCADLKDADTCTHPNSDQGGVGSICI